MIDETKRPLFKQVCPNCYAKLFYSLETIPKFCPVCGEKTYREQYWYRTNIESKYDYMEPRYSPNRALFHRGIPLSESTQPEPESVGPSIHCGNCKAVLASADYVYTSGAIELRCVNCGLINTVVAGTTKKSEPVRNNLGESLPGDGEKPAIDKTLPYSGERWEDKSTRAKILHQALEIVTKDRNQDYGNPEDNFATIANYWTEYLHSKGLISRQDSITNVDVAAMMILMKCSRLATSPDKMDHWIDIAGYSACGGDCVQ